jgi:HprK-related kinase A
MRGPFTLINDHRQEFEVEHKNEVLPHLEWFINWQIIERLHTYVQLHASSLVYEGGALILPGDPGSGKSTLTAGLLARGWSYLCDEFALVDTSRGLIAPFPRALCIKEASFPVLEALGLPLRRKTPYQKATKGRVGFLNPLDIDPGVVSEPAPARWVVFPKYVAGATPLLEPITRSQALYDLTKQCFNFRMHQENVIKDLASLVRGAECFRLVAGEIQATCDLVESLASQRTTRRAG